MSARKSLENPDAFPADAVETASAERLPLLIEGDDATPSARTLQEQRSQQVRDINARIAGLEEHITGMADALASSREHVGTAFEKLERQVRQAESLLQKQERQVGHLQAAQLELRMLYDQLDAVRRQHGAAIDALALDTRRRFDETRAGLSQLHGIVQQHRDTLLAHRQDHEQVARHVGNLQAQVDDMGTRLHARVDALEEDVQTRAATLGERIDAQAASLRRHADAARQGFRRHGLAMGVLAAVALGLTAWHQAFPSAVPVAVETKLAALDNAMQQQAALAMLQTEATVQNLSAVSSLQAFDAAQSSTNARLQTQDALLARQLGAVRNEQRQLAEEFVSLRSAVDAP